MRYGLEVSSVAALEPVSLSEAQTHLRVTQGVDDGYIEDLIKVARRRCEDYTRRAFITQTLKMYLDRFPDRRSWDDESDRIALDPIIRLPRGPVQSITSVAYTDQNGDAQTLDSSKYTLDSKSQIPRLLPAYGEVWPSTQLIPNAVTITFVVGYGDTASTVPVEIKHAIKLAVGTWYDAVRAGVGETPLHELPESTFALLDPYVIPFSVGDGS